MLRVAPDAMRADFRRFYLLNSDDWPSNPLYYADLAANLPEQAVVWRRIDPRLAWTTTQQLLANVADSTSFLAWTKTDDAYNGGSWRGAVPRPQGEQHAHGFTKRQIDSMRGGRWVSTGAPHFNKPANVK